jgi:hypothetical protein
MFSAFNKEEIALIQDYLEHKKKKKIEENQHNLHHDVCPVF